MGTHVIEAGFPVNSEAEFEAVRDIADATSTTVCGLARVVDEDIDAALESGVEMVHVFCSTSDVQLQDSMHASREEALERSVEAVERVREAGAAQSQVSVNGIGERAGNAAYEEVVMALESLYDVDTGIRTDRITELARIIEAKSDIAVPANKPIVGDNAFSHESGIHAAGVIENADTFEPGVMTPEMVGASRELVLGKHTGTHSVRERLVDAGFEPTDAEVREVTRMVKETGARDERVTFERLKEFARDVGVRREEVRV